MTKRRDVIVGLAGASLILAAAGRSKAAESKEHRVVFQVSDNRVEIMNLALNNAANVSTFFAESAEDVQIEIVAYGPGLHMFRIDTSPIRERVTEFPKSMKNVVFSACGNTIESMTKNEGKAVSIFPGIRIVKAGVVRLMELQEAGWSYIKV